MNEVELLQQAKQAIQAGDKATAQRFLIQVIKQTPRSETAWLWLSAIVDDPAWERECLERVLEINPENPVAKRHFADLILGKSASAPPSPKPQSAHVQPQAPQSQPTPQPPVSPPVPCPYCAEPIRREAVVCRFCGRNVRTGALPVPVVAPLMQPSEPPKKFRKLTLYLVGAVVIASLICCGLFNRTPGTESPSTTDRTATRTPSRRTAKSNVEIMDGWTHRYLDSLGDWLIEGKIKNVGTRSLRFVEIRGTIKDKNGKEVGTNTSYMDSDILAPGATSGFSVYVSDPDEAIGGTVYIRVEDASFAN